MDVREPPEFDVSNERVVRTYDRLSRTYDLIVGPLQAAVRRRAIDLLAPGDGDRVLEIGCGPGHALVELAPRVASGHVYGLDAAERMLARARGRCEQSVVSGRISLLAGDARALPICEEAFDAVFIEATLELFSPAEMRTVLAEVARVLDDDGRLCVVTMDREGVENTRFVRLYEWIFEHVPGYQSVGCRPVYARRALETAGFTIDRSLREYHLGVWPIDVILARPRPIDR